MKKLILNIALILSFIFFLGCKTDNVEGIKIEKLLVEKQSYSENREMIELIKLSLLEDKKSFENLLFIPKVDDGESAYIHGSTICQIIYTLGESKVINMIKDYDTRSLNFLKSYIGTGFDYSDDYNDNFKDEFPKLFKYINEKLIN